MGRASQAHDCKTTTMVRQSGAAEQFVALPERCRLVHDVTHLEQTPSHARAKQDLLHVIVRHIANVRLDAFAKRYSRDATVFAMTISPNLDTQLQPLSGAARPLEQWLTTFHLASIVLDPYTNESAWILKTAVRILRQFTGASVRTNFVVTATAKEAREFLGPFADEFLVFCDPSRTFVKQLALTELPAFVYVQIDGTVPVSAQGWNAKAWSSVAEHIASVVAWHKPNIPIAGDPGSFKGSPALT